MRLGQRAIDDSNVQVISVLFHQIAQYFVFQELADPALWPHKHDQLALLILQLCVAIVQVDDLLIESCRVK